MNRRKFSQNMSLLAAAAALPALPTLQPAGLIQNIGIQLFSLPKMLEKDFQTTIAMLAGMGYREVELFGPYTFSAESAKANWQAITPMLGFSGSGFFGLTANQISSILKDSGISVPSMHTDLETLETRMEQLGEAASALGCKYAGIAAIPRELRQNLDDYKRMVETFNKIGAAAKKVGLRFSYHNHGYGLRELEGKIPLQLLLEETDPEQVFFEMDIFWTTAGGADPAACLKDYPGRYHLMHVKDMKQAARFSGDGGDPRQWIELFPQMTSAGKGVLNLPEIMQQAVKSGVKHFFVEQDMVADPEVALADSINYLKKL